jgi:uncharacterized protein with NAD-binding domain and iron-sulfur cluster
LASILAIRLQIGSDLAALWPPFLFGDSSFMPHVPGKKHKLAVIGGGMASISAVFEITSQAGWSDLYDITVYQTGFRLGGKGASGRNREHGDRIEEHGLHIFMGFYENAFRILRACYKELDRPPGAPLRTWREAFHPHEDITLYEQVEGAWKAWPLPFPRTAGDPGDGGLLPPMWSYVPMILEAMLKTLAAFQSDASSVARVLNSVLGAARDEIESLLNDVMGDSQRGTVLRRALRAAPEPAKRFAERAPVQLFVAVLKAMRKSAEELGMDNTGTMRKWAVDALLPVLDHMKNAVWEEIGERAGSDDHARRTWILMDLMATNLRGMIKDDLVFPPFPFDDIDKFDYKEWLRQHGAHSKTVDSAPVNAIYDLVFARHSGIGAGAALRGSLRMMLAYKGSIFYKMQAGMGDVVFGPLYEVLRRRGVKFRFFHRLDNVRLAADKTHAAALEFGLQATMKNGGEYEPLYSVKGLPCWPSQPLWEQLVEGERFQREGVDLENFFSKSHDVEKVVLQVGRDFDSVVLGVSIGALPHVAAEVIENSPRLRGAVENVRTTATQAVQLWLRPDLQGLGWQGPSPVVGTFAKPFDTWADMTHLVPRESFEPGEIGNIAYFCGHLPDPELLAGVVDPHVAANRNTRENTIEWLDKYTAPLWPRATRADRPGGLDYELLVDRAGRPGVSRLDGQYVRANVNPSDRYVLSVPGSAAFRPRTEETNLRNLFVTGDWIQNGVQGGCAEAAAMAGVQTARAICGRPIEILGDNTAPPSRVLVAALPAPRRDPHAYIERGGELVLRGPYAQNGSRIYGFLLPAQMDRLSALCDRYLNIGKTKYRPLGPFVSLVCADIAEIRSLHPEEAHKGYIPEKDVAFWVPVMAGSDEYGVFVPKRVVWFLPYIFVDNAAAAATGREIYGFPKSTGRIEFGEPGESGPLVTVDALAMDTYSPATLVKNRRIIEVRRKADEDHGPVSRLWLALEGALAGISSGFIQAAKSLAAEAEAEAITSAFLEVSPSRPTRMVFLKQIRDAADHSRACYQSIVEATARVTAFRGGGRLEGDYEVILPPLASHPIASDLGLSSSPIAATFDAWLDFDFDVDAGEEIP